MTISKKTHYQKFSHIKNSKLKYLIQKITALICVWYTCENQSIWIHVIAKFTMEKYLLLKTFYIKISKLKYLINEETVSSDAPRKTFLWCFVVWLGSIAFEF